MSKRNQNDPYVYPDTQVLINKFGLKDTNQLQEVEGFVFALKNTQPLPAGNLDFAHLKAIHKHFFGSVYAWAGEVRTIDIAKGDSYFANCNHIDKSIDKILAKLSQENYLTDLNKAAFCEKLSYYFNEINAVHPFREGNGRVQRAFCGLIAEKAGYRLYWQLANEREYIQASMTEILNKVTRKNFYANDISKGYDLSLMSGNRLKENVIEFECTDKEFKYRVVGLSNGKIEKDIILWGQFPNDFPRQPNAILQDKIKYLPQILALTSKKGHTLFKEKNIASIKEKLENGECKDIQIYINTYLNYRSYSTDRENLDFVFAINDMAEKYVTYLDCTEEKFSSDFYGNYAEKLFELSIAKFLSFHFECIKRESPEDSEADLHFLNRGTLYFLECSLAAKTSLMSEFLESLNNFDHFYQLCLEIQKTHEKNYCNTIEKPHWINHIGYYAKMLNYKAPDFNNLITKNGSTSFSDALIALEKWAHIQHYVYHYYKEFIPESFIGKLSEIMPFFIGVNYEKIRNFIIRRIILKITEKIKKSYCNKGIPVVIAVSLASSEMEMFIHSSVNPVCEIFHGVEEALKKKYDLSLKSTGILKEKVIEFECTEESFNYRVVSLSGNKIEEGIILWNEFSQGFPKENESILQDKAKYLPEILALTSKKGHTQNLDFSNLYAIIIDTTWYNWFPEIVEEELGARFPVNAKNTFHVIYNSNSPIKERIFDNIIGGKSLTFSL